MNNNGGRIERILASIERGGNRLPDPAILFFFLLLITWALSAVLAQLSFGLADPRTDEPLRVVNQLTGENLAAFLAGMVETFITFHPLGVVLVAMLGVGVAEHTGLVRATLRHLLAGSSGRWLAPGVVLVGVLSHIAADAGYVVVIPLGAVIFMAAGRHPLAGIAAAFAGVSGGFSAGFLPTAIDPLLQGITQEAGRIMDNTLQVNPLANLGFTAVSCLLIVPLGWYITERIIEPRLRDTPVDGDGADEAPRMEALSALEKRGLCGAAAAAGVGMALLVVAMLPADSALRAPDGEITSFDAPLMQSIVPLIFLLFLIPGLVYGYLAGTIAGHRDVVDGMSRAMSGMGYYIVLAFFAALFIDAFARSNLGLLVAVYGAEGLRALDLPAQVTIVGVILLTGLANLFIGSASAKWALLAPILVPMLMGLGIAPELTQAAYRVGDSATNIITPLMPYFPLVVVYCKRYYSGAGIGTLISLMLPYSVAFLIAWTLLLLGYWALGLPLGLQSAYTWSP